MWQFAISIWKLRLASSFACLAPAVAARPRCSTCWPGSSGRRPARSRSPTRAIERPGADRGVVFQGDDSLYPWLSALGNVEFGLRMRGLPRAERLERARRYLDLVGLGGQGHKYPAELSGGMKQRIQIARVLANEPQMLLMDEPFAALDAHTRAAMQRELIKIWRATKKTVLFITHDIDEAIMLGN